MTFCLIYFDHTVSTWWIIRCNHPKHSKFTTKGQRLQLAHSPCLKKWTDLALLTNVTTTARHLTYTWVKSTRQNNNKCACTTRCFLKKIAKTNQTTLPNIQLSLLPYKQFLSAHVLQVTNSSGIQFSLDVYWKTTHRTVRITRRNESPIESIAPHINNCHELFDKIR